MASEGLSVGRALESLKQVAPWVCPNPGFMHQLALFADMGCSLKPDYPPYRALLFSQRRQMVTLNARPLPKMFKVTYLIAVVQLMLLATQAQAACAELANT